MALQIANFRVDVDGGEGLTFPCVTLLNRRGGGAPVLLRWVFQRSLEVLLFRRTDGGSTGAIWKALNNTGLQSTSLLCDRKAVNNDVLLDPELQQIMAAFKASLQPGQHDPSALGRIRSCTLLPLATAAAVCRQYGRSPASMGFLRCFHQQVPTNWELQEEAEQDAADGFYDPILHDKLDEHGFEAEELTIAQELTQVPEFVDTADDETKLRSYALSPTASLKRQLAAFVAHRTATFSARRSGGAVQSVSAEANCYGLLRFLGWMQKTNQAPVGATLDIDFLARADLGTKAQQWAQWLQQTQQIRFTSICNYLSSLVSMANYVYFELAVAEEVLGMSPNPLEQLVNLRDQAHGAIKEQNLYTPANVKGGLITWPQAQETRVKVLSAVTARPPTATLKEAAMVSLMTLIPPDRVGVIRRLRFQHTLKRRESCWVVDLSKRGDGHKTSKHYGPFHGELPTTLNGVLDSYKELLAFEAATRATSSRLTTASTAPSSRAPGPPPSSACSRSTLGRRSRPRRCARRSSPGCATRRPAPKSSRARPTRRSTRSGARRATRTTRSATRGSARRPSTSTRTSAPPSRCRLWRFRRGSRRRGPRAARPPPACGPPRWPLRWRRGCWA